MTNVRPTSVDGLEPRRRGTRVSIQTVIRRPPTQASATAARQNV